ncbi:SWI/SNF-RELATED MATRIX-ASSOCIATED ACTIN-DEPENDENT REGULATOR OF CHROMATIN SUBFAMILY D [Salix viminalis]|uniref:SWI/SNF-RELATED MATRIX-ASSOCIATED ACTIN-DEPENDENT REGULATOR OF CHROMATIN SUBFAMILY D n=1 Tax=Salix viminalis TaxID=40686 RepID=A0A9Q0QJN5_SALVM|nr:SWI/SNF-RELATED MATRIX-ASSOCIATED ACTIN-DEPENDENT REGULATOR OF CHROMATIN SUBFAMILY D [Salix viminalis]
MGWSNKTGKVRKRGGFTKLSSLSPQLQAVVGVPELARTEVVKKLWAYIREKNLQDPKNRKNIKCDDALRAVFCVNLIDMFQMNKALSKHIWPLTGEDENVKHKGKWEEEEEQEEEEEAEEEEVKKESKERSKKGRKSAKVDENVKKRGGGFTKLCSLSPQLQEFVGVPELARTGVVKKLWAYIREMNLQDPKNKRNIICDESLRALFNVDSIDMFQMNKALSKHIWAVCEENAPSNSSSKEKGAKQGREEDPDEPKPKEKRQKKGASGLLAPLQISDALDPADKRRIICDDKLKELFEVDSFTGFTVSRLLSSHFIKTEQ